MKIPKAMRTFWERYWPCLMVFGVILLFYHKILLCQGAWIVGDHAEQHFPWAFYFAECLRKGSLPFWTDLIHAGFPLVAEGQVGAFYLPNLFFYGIFSIKAGYAWNIIFHLMLSAFFMTQYLRSLKLDPRAVLLGTLVYMFGSTLGGAYYNITSLKVLTWFPLTLLVIDRILVLPKFQWRWPLFLGFLYSLSLLAGYLQFAAYALLFSLLYFVFRWLESAPRSWRLTTVAWGSLFIAVLVGVFLSFPQLYLTFELAIRSNRAAVSEDFAYVGSYSPLAAICLFYPSLEGFFSSKLYLGVFPVFFMIVAFYFFKEEKRKSFYFLVLTAFLLALGQFSPIFIAIVKTFHVYSLRTPVKFVFFAGFFLSVLAAMGCHRLITGADPKRVARSANAYVIICTIAALAVLGSFLAFLFFPDVLEKIGAGLLEKFVYARAGHPHSWDFYVQKLHGVIQNGCANLRPLSRAVYLPFLKMITACGVIIFFVRKRISVMAFLIFAFALIVLDLNFSYSDIRGDYGSYRSFFEPNRTTAFLQENLKGGRYFVYSQNPSESPLPASKNMIHGLATANAYSPLILKDYYDFWGPLGGINDSVSYQEVNDTYLLQHLNLLRMLNVSYIVSDRMLRSDSLPLVFQDAGWMIYEVQSPMPKFFLIKNYKVIEDRKALLAKLRQTSFDPVQVVYLDSELRYYGKPDSAITHDGVTVASAKPDEIRLMVESSRDQVLVISQLFYPGWTVEVDGENYPVIRCNYILSGVPLTQGWHTLTLRYRPFSSV